MSASSIDGGGGFSFFGDMLKPGSSLNPAFLAVVDAAFVSLFLVFVGLAFVTSGNFHIFALMAIELALWASVKWFVNELKNTPVAMDDQNKGEELKESKKDS